MTNTARGEVAFELGGETYVLRPSFGAVAEIEDAIGTNLFEMGRKLERAEITARELVKFAHACVAQSGYTVAEAELAERIVAQGAFNVVAALVKFCQSYAFGGHEKKKAETAPDQEPSGTAATTSENT